MTQRLFYSDSHIFSFDATVLNCRESGKFFEITLDRTAFYPEGGGQPGDTGTLGGVTVTDTREKDGDIVHITEKPIAAGTKVRGELDWDRRFDFMQQHSGEHILSGILNRRFGCDNVGFHMGADVVTIDFNCAVPEAELYDAEAEANRFVWQNLPVEITFPSAEELKDIPYRSKKELSGEVRIVTFPGADICACCGTHVKYTGEIGLIKILSLKKFRDGVRIEMVSGKRAYDHISTVCEQNRKISGLLSAKIYETSSAASRLLDENNALKRRFYEAEEKMIAERTEQFRGAGNTLIFERGLAPDTLRKLCDSVASVCEGRCAVFSGCDGEGYKYTIISPDDLREFVKNMNAALDGRGGGKGGFVQGYVNAFRKDIDAFFAQNNDQR